MEMSGQIHFLATLPLDKEPLAHNDYERLGEPQTSRGHFRDEMILFWLLGILPLLLSCPAQNTVTIPLEISFVHFNFQFMFLDLLSA